MIAVTERSWNVIDTLRTPTISPNRASSRSTRMCGIAPASVPATSTGVASVTGAVAATGDDACDEADDKDEAEEDEGARPRLIVPVIVGTGCIVEDL